MRIGIIKACKFSFAVAEKIVYFKVGEVCELPEDRALKLINNGYATECSDPKPLEQKMDKTETENKMFNVKHKEDKTENEVKVTHEDSVEKKEEKQKKRGRPKKNK